MRLTPGFVPGAGGGSAHVPVSLSLCDGDESVPDELIISVSGLRGIVGENLTAQVATEYGCAFGSFLRAENVGSTERLTVCIGQDSRPSGAMVKAGVTAGLCSAGVDVIDIGLVPTPTVGVMLRHLGCAGGVVITASHNPIPYNGIKLLLGNGVAPPADCAARIKGRFLDKDFDTVDSVSCGSVAGTSEADAIHIARVLGIVEQELIAGKCFKVVLDSVNGAGGPITKRLLAEFGCDVLAMNDEPTGIFAHTPEPTVDNLTGLCEAVKSSGAQIGLAQDPDADRLAIVDEHGTYIGEEYTLALAAKLIFGKHKGKAAANLSTSRMIDDIAGKSGSEVIRTPVGEAHVAGAMVANDCVIGGEGNGGIIDLRVGPVRDSLVGISLVLQLMAETGRSVSDLVAEIGGYYMHKEKFSADREQAGRIVEMAKEAFPEAKIDTRDGCRFDFEDGWLHLRSSNTEPVMRCIVEAKDEVTAGKYLQCVQEIRSKALA